MRNLRSIRYDVCRAAAEATAVCWDAGRDEILAAFGPSADEPRVRLVRVVDQDGELESRPVASWDALSPSPDLPVDRVVSLHYFGDLATACVVLAGGDIVTVREAAAGRAESSAAHIEIVGSVDPGIAAACWSPDEEVLALVPAGAGSLLLMSRGFETISETPLTPADLAASKHVSVGWGKKETQFKGRGAAGAARAALRDPTIPEVVDEGTLQPGDDGAAVTISWRGDGEYVAVNAVETVDPVTPEKRRRVVRVFNREGALDSASEPVDGLASCLSWRPAGNLMATVQRKPAPAPDAASAADADTFHVIFFERNGLRHGQFALRPPSTAATAATACPPRSLDWNYDSTVLAVTYDDVLQLWTMGNYHWYLKQEIRTGGALDPLTAWHPEKPLRLLSAARDGLVRAEYVFATARGSLAPPLDHGSLAVVDGTLLKLTPMWTTNMPPPMSLFDVPTRLPVADVAFAPNDDAFAVLHPDGVDVFAWAWPSTGKRPPQPKLAASLSLAAHESLAGLVPLQVAFLHDEATKIICVLGWRGALQIVSLGLDPSAGQLRLTGLTEDVSSGSVLVPSHRGRELFTQDAAGALARLDTQILSFNPLYERPPVFLPWADVVDIGEDSGLEGKVVVGQSRNGHLYANERQLVKNCTSFVVTDDHLIFTTSNHLLKFVHMAEAHELQVPLDDPEVDERCRSIEQGARLVTAMPSESSVVLQMPRGNLETIFPRAMVVANIRKRIDSLDYGRAFAFCRTQRVDMNILYDHKPSQFLANVGLFLDQLKDVAFIDLFLSSLRSEDVTKTMYKDTKQAKASLPGGLFGKPQPESAPPPPPPSAKVNAICEAVLAGLAMRKKTNLQNIITAQVCKVPPALDDGLRFVEQLFRENAAVAEGAVEHICFLVDVNRLYDHALGLYNLELTLQVAQKSQRDPREYLPFMQELHAMPELRRRFAIDDHLGRHEKALAHLQALDAFDEVLDYTSKHRLYACALGMYRYDPPRLATVTNAYAGYLEAQSKFRDAGLAYESLGNLAKATSCYQSAGVSCWRECLFAAQSQRPPLSADALKELASTLVDALVEARDYAAAATLQLDYLASVDAAVRSLCKGYEFAEAMRVAVLRGRADLLEAAVDAGLGEALSSSTELLADCRSQLKAQVPRILELRKRALEDPLGFYEGERPGGDDVPDDISVAASSRLSTGASLFTRYSTGTGATGATGQTGGTGTTAQHRNRRKREEKKRARGRKGTVYEQEYLVSSVRRLVERVERARPEVDRLVVGLVRRSMAERARAIQGLMAELVEACQAAIREVWAAEDGPRPLLPGDAAGEGRETGPTGRLESTEPPLGGAAPVIAAFGRLSLLG